MLIKENMSDAELDAFILYIEETEMLNAPKNLKQRILDESRKEKVQINSLNETKRKMKKMSAKVEFFTYTLKISAAIAAAIFLLAFIDTDSVPAFSEPKRDMERKTMVTFLNEKSNEWSDKLNQFSNMLY